MPFLRAFVRHVSFAIICAVHVFALFYDADDSSSVDELGFLADGYFITSPNVTECGRFFVDPIVYYGQPYIDWAKEREKVSSI